MSYIEFRPTSVPTGYVTQIWVVVSKSDGLHELGKIKWYAPWRRYCLSPRSGSIWSSDCLRDVATFCEEQTEERKSERAREAMRRVPSYSDTVETPPGAL